MISQSYLPTSVPLPLKFSVSNYPHPAVVMNQNQNIAHILIETLLANLINKQINKITPSFSHLYLSIELKLSGKRGIMRYKRCTTALRSCF